MRLPKTYMLLALVAVALSGCREGWLTSVNGDVVASPGQVEFAPTWMGHPTEQTVTLSNRSRAAQGVSLTVEGPFEIDAAELEVPGGGAVEIVVAFAPQQPGEHHGLLRITSNGGAIDVTLTGRAKVAPQCASSSPCRTPQIDPATGECGEMAVADDTPCASESACVVDGRCVDGTCVGAELSCDDGNPCTVDACSAKGGCVYLDATPQCPQPASPCQVAFCDPKTGCGITEAPDETPCGASTCETAKVCLSGQCRDVKVPEGASCTTSGVPCPTTGTCQNRVCVAPPPPELVPAWTYEPVGTQLFFQGIADADENLYWTECSLDKCTGPGCTPCDAVSFTRDGVERWRQPLIPSAGPLISPHAQMLVGDTLITLVGDRMVEARRKLDGAFLWKRDVRADVESPLFEPNIPAWQRETWFGTPAADEVDGRVIVTLEARHRTQTTVTYLRTAMVWVDVSTGALIWAQILGGRFPTSVVDEGGYVYAATDTQHYGMPYGPYTVFSFRHDGLATWVKSVPEGQYPAISGGFVVLGGTLSLNTSAGIQRWYDTQQALGPAVMGLGSAWSLRHAPTPGRVELVKQDAQLGTRQWSVDLGELSWANDLTLTANAAALVLTMGDATRFGPGELQLREIDVAGNQTFACPLPSGFVYWHALTLLKDRVVLEGHSTSGVRIAAFDVPGRSLRTVGWPTSLGNNQRNNRAR